MTVFGAVVLSNGKVVDLDGSKKSWDKLVAAVKKDLHVTSIDPDGNLGKEANVYVDFSDELKHGGAASDKMFTTPKSVEKFVKKYIR